MAHTPFHKVGQVHTGYYTREGLPKFDYFPGTRNSQIVGVNRRPEYFTHLNQRDILNTVKNQGEQGKYGQVIGVNRRPEFLNQGGTGLLNTVNEQANTPTYDFWSSKLGGGLIGAASDIAEGADYLKKGYDYGQLATDKFINKPIAKLLEDPYGSMPFSLRTTEEIQQDIEDTKIHEVQPGGALGADFAEYSNIRRWIPGSEEYEADKALGKFDQGYTTKEDILKKQHYDQRTKDWEEIKSGKVWETLFGKVDTKDKTQENATTIIQDGTGINYDAAKASGHLGTALDSDKDDTWQSRVNSGLNSFLERLGNPGFQAALTMHMEAKNGGDATDVLFAGVKQTNISNKALMQGQMNEIKLLTAKLTLANLVKGMGTAEPPTTNMKAIVGGLIQGYDLQEQHNPATIAISNYAMQLKLDNNLSDNEAALQAVQLAKDSKSLEPDRWFDQFAIWGDYGGGEFDMQKLVEQAPTAYNPGASGITQVTTQEQYDALPSGTAYLDTNNGRTGIKP